MDWRAAASSTSPIWYQSRHTAFADAGFAADKQKAAAALFDGLGQCGRDALDLRIAADYPGRRRGPYGAVSTGLRYVAAALRSMSAAGLPGAPRHARYMSPVGVAEASLSICAPT